MTSTTSPVDPLDVAAHAESVRALARRLVRDGGAAEDVAQDAWLVALRGAPRGDVPFSWWMRGVVRNVVRHARRDDATRRRHEVAAPPPRETPSPAALVERTEIHHRLVGAVLALEEPYRTTILMRFFEDLSAAEIARRVGVPAGTVRSRLKRGLDMLRARLDGDSDGDRRRWALALVPFAWTGRARHGVPAALVAAACLLVAVGAGIALLHWRTTQGDEASGDVTTASVGPAADARAAVGRDSARRPRGNRVDAVETPPAEDETAVQPAPAPAADAPNPDGLTGASIEVVDEDGSRVREGELRLDVDFFRQDLSALDAWVGVAYERPLAGTNPLVVGDIAKACEGLVVGVFARVPGLPPTAQEKFTVRAGRLASVRLVAAKPRSADVLVVDRTTDLPVADASVVSTTELERRGIFATDVRCTTGPGTATTDADGRCRVEGLGRGEREFEIDAKGYVRGHATWTDGELRVRIDPQRGSGTVTVSVFDNDGLPFAGIGVRVSESDRVVRTDGNGRAVFADVAPGFRHFGFDFESMRAARMSGRLDVDRTKIPDGPYSIVSVDVEAGGTYGVTLGLAKQGTACIDARCVGEDGAPLAGIRIEMSALHGSKAVTTDETGSARFAELVPDRYCPHIVVGRNASWWFGDVTIVVADGGYAARTYTLGSNTVRGRVVAGADRHGVSGIDVWVDGRGLARTDVDGRFELAHAPSGTFEVTARSEIGGVRRTSVKIPADGEIVLELVAYGRVAVRFDVGDRAQLQGAAFRLYRADGDEYGTEFRIGAGQEDLVSENVLPGRYQVRVTLDGRTKWLPVDVTSDKTSVVEVRAP